MVLNVQLGSDCGDVPSINWTIQFSKALQHGSRLSHTTLTEKESTVHICM